MADATGGRREPARARPGPVLLAAAAAAAGGALVALALAFGLAGCRAGVTRGEVLYADALEKLALGDSAAAIATLRSACYEMPRDPRVHAALGALLARHGTIEARAQAEKLLRLAVSLAPEVGAYAAALGELQRVQHFYGESTSMLRRSLRLDPGLGHAWLALALNLQREYAEDPTSQALADSILYCCERALDVDPDNEPARWRVAYLLMARGRPEQARAVVRAGLERRPSAARLALTLAAIEYRSQRIEAASQALDAALACLRAEERDSLLSPRRLMAPDSVPGCDPCTAAARDSFVARFWWALDPTPASEVNERLLEHVARVADADFHFGVPELRLAGRDADRGDIYVRYGPPDEARRDLVYNAGAWRWMYEALEGQQEEFVFVDTYHNRAYRRLGRGTGADYSRRIALERAPERTLIDPGPQAPGWQHVARLFRTASGRAAVELAFEIQLEDGIDSLHVDATAWRGPGARAAGCAATLARADLWPTAEGRAVGRLRLEVPDGQLALGVQVTGWDAVPDLEHGLVAHRAWTAADRDSVAAAAHDRRALDLSDLLLAHELREGTGGPFDLGGVIAVPRVDPTIRGRRLHLYFEVYPGDALGGREPLFVTYRVESLPPRWHFRDQFDAEARARRGRQPAVESTFRLQPRHAVERQRLAIDIRNLDPGDYRLLVEVARPGQAKPVRRATTFIVAAPPGAAR